MYTFGGIVTKFLANWDPAPSYVVYPFQARAAIVGLWEEAQQAATLELWRCVQAMVGQVLEAQIRQAIPALISAETNEAQRAILARDFRKAHTLGALLQVAVKSGAYPNPFTGSGLRIAGSAWSAKELRNLSSHPTGWEPSRAARRASILLALTIANQVYLFPPPTPPANSAPSILSDAAFTRESMEGTPLDNLVSLLAHYESVPPVPEPLLDSLVSRLSPSALAKHWRRWRRDEAMTDALRCAFDREFSAVVARAALAPAEGVRRLVAVLRGLELVPHSQVLAGALPYDKPALAYLAKQSPNALARHLYMCRRADAELFRSIVSAGPGSPLREVLDNMIDHQQTSISNYANILSQLAPTQQRAILIAEEQRLIQWVRNDGLWASLPLLSLLRAPLRELDSLRSAVCSAILAKANGAEAAELASIPLRLSQLRLLDDSISTELIENILNQAPDIDDGPAVDRLLWDLVAFSKAHSEPAARCALQYLSAHSGPLGTWSACALAGTLIMVGRLDRSLRLDVTEIVCAESAPNVSPYSLARALVGAGFYLGAQRLKKGFVEDCATVLRNIPKPQNSLSRRLLLRAWEVIDADHDAGRG